MIPLVCATLLPFKPPIDQPFSVTIWEETAVAALNDVSPLYGVELSQPYQPMSRTLVSMLPIRAYQIHAINMLELLPVKGWSWLFQFQGENSFEAVPSAESYTDASIDTIANIALYEPDQVGNYAFSLLTYLARISDGECSEHSTRARTEMGEKKQRK